MKAFFQLVREDHKRDPDALPWVLEMTGISFAVVTVPTILLWTEALWQLTIPAGVLAITMSLRELARRWEP